MSGLGKLRGLLSTGKEAVTENSDLKDAAGLALGGPLYSVAKELKEAMPDSVRNAMDERKARKEEARDIARAVKADGGRERDDKGRYKPDQDSARRETAQIEVAQAELALEEREAKADAKRHKELVRAVKANHRGLLDRFMDARMLGRRGRDRIIREGPRGRGSAVDVERRRRGGGRDVDIGVDGRRRPGSRGRSVAAEIDPRRGGGRAGARAAGRKGLLGGLAAVGGGMGRAAAGAGRAASGVLAMGGKAAGGLLRALPGIGQVLALGMAAYDGFQGWNDKDLHREAFGLKEGQEATTGQKAAAAGASILDMGGLTSGLLGLFGIEFDKAGVAQGLYQFGSDIATIAGNFKQEFDRLLPEVWTGIQNLGSQVWEGAKNIGGKLADFAAGTLESGMGMLSGLWEGGKAFIGDIWGKLGNFASSAISGAGEMLSGLWKSATELPGKIKDFAANAAEKGGQLFSSGLEWAREKAHSAWEGTKNFASSAWEGAKGLGGKLWGRLGPSEAHADELPKNPQERQRVIEEAQRRQQDMAQAAQQPQAAQQAILPASQKEALPPTSVPIQPTFSVPPAPAMPPAPALPLEQVHMVREANDAQEKLNENMEALTAAVKEQTRLMDEERQAQLFGDNLGFSAAVADFKSAVQDVQRGGQGYMRGTYNEGGAPDPNFYGNLPTQSQMVKADAQPMFVPEQGKEKRGIRNNNPGNIDRLKGERWVGEINNPNESRHATFITPEHGLRALGRNLMSYKSKHGLDTINGIIDRWAPPNENDTEGYKKFVEQKLGVDRNAKLDMKDPKVLTALAHAIVRRENSVDPYTDEQYQKGIEAALGMRELDIPEAVRMKLADVSPSVAAAAQNGNVPSIAAQTGVKLKEDGSIDLSTLKGLQSIGYDSGNVNIKDMDPETAARMAAFAQEHEQITGEKLIISEGYRSYDEQVRLRNKLGAGLAATPGKSNHGTGVAFDIKAGGVRSGGQNIKRLEAIYRSKGLDFGKQLEKYGLYRPLLNAKNPENWHIEALDRKTVAMQQDRAALNSGKRKGSAYISDAERKLYMPGTPAALSTAVAEGSQPHPVSNSAGPSGVPKPQMTPQPVAAAEDKARPATARPAISAQPALSPQTPQAAAIPAAASAASTRKPERVESVRVIDPERDAKPGGGGDNSALLAMLGKILTAIEANGRRAAAMAKGSGGDGMPSISTEYDDPAAQGMAKDAA